MCTLISRESPWLDRLAQDSWDILLLDTGSQAEYLSSQEKDVLLLMNAARQNPPRFADLYIQEYRGYYSGSYLAFPGEIRIRTQEGTRVVDELIRAMNEAPSRGILQPSLGMSRASKDHAETQGPTGRTGHDGVDGSSFTQRVNRYGSWQSNAGENISYGYSDAYKIVMQLLVDDGVSSRGHRKNIMSRDFNVCGIAIASHSQYGAMCVIDYAGGYQEK
ncbi:MAG: CAP domain-containing protein [Spirochaetaceae bacterium]|jgi:uncharacterized protein YkwD|nr:CAP domain-containing protein [Spirochaetaceae bacterium]